MCSHCYCMNECTPKGNAIRPFKYIWPRYNDPVCRRNLFLTSWSTRLLWNGFYFVIFDIFFSIILFSMQHTVSKVFWNLVFSLQSILFFIQVVYKLKNTADLQVYTCSYTLLTIYLNICMDRTFVKKKVSFIFRRSVHF